MKGETSDSEVNHLLSFDIDYGSRDGVVVIALTSQLRRGAGLI